MCWTLLITLAEINRVWSLGKSLVTSVGIQLCDWELIMVTTLKGDREC